MGRVSSSGHSSCHRGRHFGSRHLVPLAILHYEHFASASSICFNFVSYFNFLLFPSFDYYYLCHSLIRALFSRPVVVLVDASTCHFKKLKLNSSNLLHTSLGRERGRVGPSSCGALLFPPPSFSLRTHLDCSSELQADSIASFLLVGSFWCHSY